MNIATGIDASPGAAVGRAAFTAEDAVEMSSSGPVILVRKETTPDDIHGMDVAKGILTAVGGKSSHAAVVARGMGRPCIVGAGAIAIDEHGKKFTVTVNEKTVTVKEGDWISMDGTTAKVYLGKAVTKEPDPTTSYFGKLMTWADEFRGGFGVRANADIPRDAKVARLFGAEGIGLCRTEHMFFAEDRIPFMQAMILARDVKSRTKALQKLLPMQRKDFIGLFQAMDGLPVVIRTLDPPLHEFLPKREDLMVDLARLPHAGKPMKKEMSEKYHIKAGDLKKQLPGIAQARRGTARVQSDAGASRMPSGDHVSRDHRNAGPRDFRSGRAGGEEGHQGDSGSYDSAGGQRGRGDNQKEISSALQRKC